MTFGTWGSPEHGQTWGEQHRCPDLTRVGPPESQPAGCGGQYRYFPGQSFPSNHTWDWTAPFTANYVLQVTANCDVPFYDDPTQPGCTVTADGVDCEDDAVTQCLAAFGLTIRVVDRSVHVKHTFDVPVTQEVLNSIELQQHMADMFALQQQPAIVFPLSITPLDCGLAENAERPSCQQVVHPGPGGGHRRRRMQTQIGADTDHTCPQSSFDTQDTAMRAACGFQRSDAADPLLQGQCPSLECARSLLPLLHDCAEHIAEFARHIGPEAAFYEALQRSEMFNNCVEMDQSAAEMASVQVEFRAPTLEVAEQMIAEHQRMVDAQFLPTSSGDEQLCFGKADESVGDGTRCGGRRQLGVEELCAEACVDKDAEIRRLKAELVNARAKTDAAVQQNAEKDKVIEKQAKVIEEQAKTIEQQANEIAFHKRLHRLRQSAGTVHNISDSARRSQAAVGRRTQASSDSSVLRSARVGVDRLVKACAVHPCELSDGICQNGGTCVEAPAEGGGAVPFECQCTGGFGGDRCESDLCENVKCGQHAACAGGSCKCLPGWISGALISGRIRECFDRSVNVQMTMLDLPGNADFLGYSHLQMVTTSSWNECKEQCLTDQDCAAVHYCDVGSGGRSGSCYRAPTTTSNINHPTPAGCGVTQNAVEVASWDAGAVTVNGHLFRLYRLPPQPANTFAFSDAATRTYADLCAAVGLRTVVGGYDCGTGLGSCENNCVQHGCFAMTNIGGGGRGSTGWVYDVTGWDNNVIIQGSTGLVMNFHADAEHGDDGLYWDVPLSPVCGTVDGTGRRQLTWKNETTSNLPLKSDDAVDLSRKSRSLHSTSIAANSTNIMPIASEDDAIMRPTSVGYLKEVPQPEHIVKTVNDLVTRSLRQISGYAGLNESASILPIKSDDRDHQTDISHRAASTDFSDPQQLKALFGVVVMKLNKVENENAALQSRAQAMEAENKAVRVELEQVKRDKAVLEKKTQISEEENRVMKVKIHDLQSAFLELASRMKGDVQNITLRLDQCEIDTHPFIKEMQASHRRHLQEEETLCRGSGMIAMFSACCPSPGDGGGHRRFMQSVQGCDALPSTCSASCAPEIEWKKMYKQQSFPQLSSTQ
eukprot:SAG22_NODE_12_length_33707_cov_70.427118_9_plen_1105_part_00